MYSNALSFIRVVFLTLAWMAVAHSASAQTFTTKASYAGEWTHFPGIGHTPTQSIYLPGGYAFGDLKQILRYDIQNDNWTAISCPAGMQSQLGYSFNIGNRMFFGGGADLGFVFGSQLWELTPPSTFTPMDNIPFPNGVSASFSFSIGGFGYVGEGYGWNGSVVTTNTLYRFNAGAPPGSQWTTMAPYPGAAQLNSGCVTLNGSAYVACGRNYAASTEHNDFWRYTPNGAGGTWSAMPAFPGAPRENPVLMRSCNNKIVLLGGLDAFTGVYYDDIWVFDPTTSLWTFLGNDPAVWGSMEGRYGPAYGTYGDSLYVGMGYGSFGPNDDWNLFTYCPVSVLPVELTTFTASLRLNQVDVTWQTQSEINNDYFEVQHSTDGVHWQHIGTVDGAGNSNEIKNYLHVHATPSSGVNYYRLKQVDFDGTQTWTNVVSVTADYFTNGGLTLYPNPVQDFMQLSLAGAEENNQYTVVDCSGATVMKGDFTKHAATVQTSSLARGVYFVYTNVNPANPVKFVKQQP